MMPSTVVELDKTLSAFEKWQQNFKESQTKEKTQPKPETAPAVGTWKNEGWDG